MSQTEEMAWSALQCAGCHQLLRDPVQLPACFHILCLQCTHNLGGNNSLTFTCPKCGEESAKECISGTMRLCNDSVDHGAANWKCLECNQCICSLCRINRHKGHKVCLLAYNTVLESSIWNAASFNATSQGEEQTDSANQSNIQCPICNGASCRHMELLHILNNGLNNSYNYCTKDGHFDDRNKPLERKYFCKVHWAPICADCSNGQHKLDETADISECGEKFIMESLKVLHDRLKMLKAMSHRDTNEAKAIEGKFKIHVADTDKELNSRKRKIIEQTEDAFDKAIASAEQQGYSILTVYREALNNIMKFQSFFDRIEKAMDKINVDLQGAKYSQYIGAFYLQEAANDLIQEFFAAYSNIAKIEERRLLLPEMEAITTPPPYLTHIKTEMTQLELAFSFELKSEYIWTDSIVLTDNDQCLLSVKKPCYETNFDGIVLCRYDAMEKSASFKAYEVEKGTYYLSRLSSGEIVASFSCNRKCHSGCSHKILYFNGILPQDNNLLDRFEVVHNFTFPPYGIATTKDNNIILCVLADELPNEGKSQAHGKKLCQVVSMSMRGKILRSSLKQPDANLMRPDYVATSDNGEICISDNENGSIVILNEDLTFKERMNYQLPTAMKDDIQKYKFRPHGVCYDTLGRIIVADPDNNSVVRLVRDPLSHKYILEPLLSEHSVPGGFVGPILVALSKDSRLWVVCTGRIFVFKYGV